MRACTKYDQNRTSINTIRIIYNIARAPFNINGTAAFQFAPFARHICNRETYDLNIMTDSHAMHTSRSIRFWRLWDFLQTFGVVVAIAPRSFHLVIECNTFGLCLQTLFSPAPYLLCFMSSEQMRDDHVAKYWWLFHSKSSASHSVHFQFFSLINCDLWLMADEWHSITAFEKELMRQYRRTIHTAKRNDMVAVASDVHWICFKFSLHCIRSTSAALSNTQR